MIYILKFAQPIGNPHNPRGQAQYYVGFCEDDRLEDRMSEHRAGHGAALTRAARAVGIGFEVVHTMPGDRAVERKIKRQKNTPRLVKRLTRNGNINCSV